MSLQILLTSFFTLLVVVDPFGLPPIFISMMQGATAEQKRKVAFLACLIAVLILAFFLFFGKEILALLGISMSAFRIAGGLLLFAVAFEMLFDIRGKRDHNDAHTAKNVDNIENLAAFPLAIPLIAGPGAITTVILFSAQASPMAYIEDVIAILAVGLCCYLALSLSGVIARMLGQTGNVIMVRLMGVLLAALSVQFIITGVQTISGQI